MEFESKYASLVNELRIRDALYLLIDQRYADCTVEDISSMVGFSNRQSFYAAFYRVKGMTPKDYRQRNMKTKSKK